MPLDVIVDKFAHTRFEPSGFTNNSRIPMAKSVTDYIARWLADRFLDPATQDLYLSRDTSAWRPGEAPNEAPVGKFQVNFGREESEASLAEESDPSVFAKAKDGSVVYQAKASVFTLQADAPPCSGCGSIMVRSGACYKCTNCGSTSGCS